MISCAKSNQTRYCVNLYSLFLPSTETIQGTKYAVKIIALLYKSVYFDSFYPCMLTLATHWQVIYWYWNFSLCQQGLSPYEKKKYVWKMLYIYMLGYDVDFGHMEAVSLISAPKYPEKQVKSFAFQFFP